MARGRLSTTKKGTPLGRSKIGKGQYCQWGKGKCFSPPTSISPKLAVKKTIFREGTLDTEKFYGRGGGRFTGERRDEFEFFPRDCEDLTSKFYLIGS